MTREAESCGSVSEPQRGIQQEITTQLWSVRSQTRPIGTRLTNPSAATIAKRSHKGDEQ
jgi:hypothetical protein